MIKILKVKTAALQGALSTALLILPVLLLTLLFKPFPADAQTEEEPVRTVEATGVATVAGGNTALARDGAIGDALRKAVEQAVGTIVASETMVENYEVLSDNVYTKTRGYVKDYSIVREAPGLDIYQVTVRATVAVGDLKDDLNALGLLMKRAGKPRVLFMIAEKAIGRKFYSFWWWGRSEFMGEVMETSSAEMSLKEIFINKGFHVVDISGSAEGFRLKDQFRVVDLTAEDTMEIGKELNADVVVYGRAQSVEGPRTPGSPVGVYLADVTAQAVRVDDGVVLASSSGHGTARHISMSTGSSEALSRASEDLAGKLIEQITRKWSSSNTVVLRVSGVPDMKALSSFIDALRRRVRGVEAVYQRKFSEGVAVLEVDSRVTAGEIAEGISRLRGIRVTVTGSTQNSVDLAIEPSE